MSPHTPGSDTSTRRTVVDLRGVEAGVVAQDALVLVLLAEKGTASSAAGPERACSVAQARTEGMWLVTADAAIQQYDVPWLDATA